ncbi:MAG: hypothetical protein SGI73_01290 [Chloroflexota bacterium]|nr:hypothetical protein [Chloroflexota bacterium]
MDNARAVLINDDWVHIRIGDGDYEAYLADIDSAWEVSAQAARLQIEAGEEPATLPECLRYTLIESSLRAWAQSSTPAVIVRTVQVGMWSPVRALSFARLIPDNARRAMMLAALAKSGLLDESQMRAAQTQAVASAKQIEFVGSRASTLSQIGSAMDAEQQYDALATGLEAALQNVDSPFGMSYSLQDILLKLPDALIARAVAGVLEVQNAEAKAWGLAILARRVPNDQREPLLQQGLDAALRIGVDVQRANALAQLAPQLTGEAVGIALDAALALKEGDWNTMPPSICLKPLRRWAHRSMMRRIGSRSPQWWSRS